MKLELTDDQALILFELTHRFTGDAEVGMSSGGEKDGWAGLSASEILVILDVQGALERSISILLDPEYNRLVSAARLRIVGSAGEMGILKGREV